MSLAEAIVSLQNATVRHAGLTIPQKISLCQQCIATVGEVAEAWIAAGSRGKECPDQPDVLAEEMLTGPVIITRMLQLVIKTLEQVARDGRPRIAGNFSRTSQQQTVVPIFPTPYLWDRLAFIGLSAEAIMQPKVEPTDIHGKWLGKVSDTNVRSITAVLGAGNVSAVSATDSLHRILLESQQVILKMNPVNDYLRPIFQKAFGPLIEAGLLRIIGGGAEIGMQLVQHPDVAEVHITGSTQTHDRIVWGDQAAEQETRKRANTPLIHKPLTSELGNVSPWIVVPGVYSNRQLRSQAEHVAASITNNAAFNCLATRVVVTCSQWKQRTEFLQLVDQVLNQTPLRPAYYPGAADRFRKHSGQNIQPDKTNCLPWLFLKDQKDKENLSFYTEESFVGFCAETAIEASSTAEFLQSAIQFCNKQLSGTLCASITFPNDFRRREKKKVEEAINKLRYSSICVNQWSGLAYSLLTPPWGGYPGATLQNIESGIGSVHNTLLLDRYEKSVLWGPLVSFPKPVWFATNKKSLHIARHLLSLYQRPNALRFGKLLATALTA
jgi:hypothetical protein